MWCIPPEQNAAFVAQMEQVLQVYARVYDPLYPVVCMDEQPKQLIRELHPPITTANAEQRTDHAYIREGVCEIWMFTEPLGCWRDARMTDRRTAVDWARQIQALVDNPRYAEAKRITLVCDNLNTHRISSLYEAFKPAEALRIANKLEMVHTPKHGSWLNMAECELSVLSRQALRCRSADPCWIREQARAWSDRRNANQIGIDWQFTPEIARTKLKQLYPKIVE